MLHILLFGLIIYLDSLMKNIDTDLQRYEHNASFMIAWKVV